LERLENSVTNWYGRSWVNNIHPWSAIPVCHTVFQSFQCRTNGPVKLFSKVRSSLKIPVLKCNILSPLPSLPCHWAYQLRKSWLECILGLPVSHATSWSLGIIAWIKCNNKQNAFHLPVMCLLSHNYSFLLSDGSWEFTKEYVSVSIRICEIFSSV
jgi:hypothetical protein